MKRHLIQLAHFIEQAIVEDSTESDRVIKDDLYRAYSRFCKEKRLAVESKENFGKILKKTVQVSRWKRGIR
jgi:Cdc6-like AAA superfamily ATPase